VILKPLGENSNLNYSYTEKIESEGLGAKLNGK
jgi:hypothetical protein